MASLELRSITKRFKTHTVLDDLSLTVADGETLVLFGPSGAGKTVLLRLIAGVVDPDAGRILIGGEDVTDVDAEFRGIGMAFQNFALFPHMSAFDNIATPLEARRTGASALKGAVEGVARLLKIGHVLGHRPRALSNGQKQRTALARALVRDPRLLVLDDALSAVDTQTERRILDALRARRGRQTLVVVAHRLSAVQEADLILVLDDGRVAERGTHAELMARGGLYAGMYAKQQLEAELAAAA